MVDDEQAVGRAPDVELDAVAPQLDRPFEGGHGVPPLDPRRPSVGDDLGHDGGLPAVAKSRYPL